jgi:hypothetical protein
MVRRAKKAGPLARAVRLIKHVVAASGFPAGDYELCARCFGFCVGRSVFWRGGGGFAVVLRLFFVNHLITAVSAVAATAAAAIAATAVASMAAAGVATTATAGVTARVAAAVAAGIATTIATAVMTTMLAVLMTAATVAARLFTAAFADRFAARFANRLFFAARLLLMAVVAMVMRPAPVTVTSPGFGRRLQTDEDDSHGRQTQGQTKQILLHRNSSKNKWNVDPTTLSYRANPRTRLMPNASATQAGHC